MTARRGWWISAIVGAAIVAVILVITLTPIPIERSYSTAVWWVVSHARHIPGLAWFNYAALERTSNALMFLPFGLVLTGLTRRWWLAVGASAALSTVIEIVQGTMLPQRTASISDVIANTVGAAIGAGIVVLVRATARRRSARRGSRSDAAG